MTISFLCKIDAQETPNFVVIFCDDLGYGDLSSFGNPTIITSNLDQMAAEGQKWTQFYVADPVCTPSRAGLLTGRYPIRSGMTSAKYGVLFPNSTGGLPTSEITIAEILKQKNYATAAVGKWHLGHLPQYLPMVQGFDTYYGIPYSNDMDALNSIGAKYRTLVNDQDYEWEVKNYNVPLLKDEEIIERPTDQTTITKRYTQEGQAFIRANKDKPFFLYLAHSMPHIPLFVSEEAKNQSKRGIYGDVIQEIDHGVGEILKTIKELKLDQKTIVIFTSDNGPWLSFKTHGGSAGPLRAGKGTTFEGGQRVPTIFWGPGYIKPGISTDLGSTLDLLPTIASLASIELPTDRKLDGFDLSPRLMENGNSPRQEFYYWTKGELYGMRSGPWKLHIKQRAEVNYGKEIELKSPELYNVEKDISEKHDLAAEFPEIVVRLLSRIDLHITDTADRLPDQLANRIKK